MDSSPPLHSPSSPTPPSLPLNSSSSSPPPSLLQPPLPPSPPSMPPPQPSPSSPPPATNNSTMSTPPPTSPPLLASPPPALAPPPSPPVSPPPVSPPSEEATPPPSSNLNPPPSPPKDTPTPVPQQPSPPPPPKTSNPPALPSPPPPQPNNSPPLIQPPSDSSPSTLSPPPPITEASYFPPPPSNGTTFSPPNPTASSTTSGSPTSHSSSSSLTVMSLAIGAAIGIGLLSIVLLAWLIISCIKKKRHAQTNNSSGSFDNGSRAGKSFYDSSHHSYSSWRNAQQPAADHVIQIPPPPRAIVSTLPSGWPTPPPPATSSTEGNSNLPSPHGADPSLTLGFNKSTFTYNELAAATNGFAFDTIIGQGGFGYVHKGVLPSGQEVAVKCLKAGSGQGDREFQAEVEIISRVHHRHLVSLVGYCIAGNQRMLVYEFLPNKTLEYHLHGKGRPPIGWSTRLRIALGSAKGIAYLHEDCHPRIIHRDIKAANILLDFNFEPKVADFGLAKLTSDNHSHVSTRIMGTFGYLAPEYAASGQLTDKSDVFSFGVMLLELITGRRPVDPTGVLMEDSLVDWARPRIGRALEESNFRELADPRLESSYVHHEMMRLAACAGSCIRHSARTRPKMSQIVRVIEGDGSLDLLSDWSKSTGQSSASQSSATGGSCGAEPEVVSYSENMRQFKKVAYNSHGYVSSEYGGTSEYGLNPSSSSSDSDEASKGESRRRGP